MISTALPDEVVRDFLVERFDDYLSLEQGSADRTREAYQRDVLRLAPVGARMPRRGRGWLPSARPTRRASGARARVRARRP